MLIPLGILDYPVAVAAAGSYDLLQTEITSAVASFTFTGLDSYTDYQHLQIRAAIRSNRSSLTDQLRPLLNGDTGTNYANHKLQGNGSSVSSSAGTSRDHLLKTNVPMLSDGSSVFAGVIYDFLDFSSTSKYKTVRALSGWTSSFDRAITLESGLWMSTSAITSITLQMSSADIGNNSRISLYGLKAA